MAQTKCQSCDAPIFFKMTPNGNYMPLNPDPSPDGNVHLTKRGAVVLTAAAIELNMHSGALLYVAHFVTCPKAAQWRSRGVKKGH
jgi:hypothetical protein